MPDVNDDEWCVRPLCFFSLCFRWARALDLNHALPKKTGFFSAQRAHWILADFWKKHWILVDKKTFWKKNKFILRNKKNFFSSYIFLLVFLSPSLTLFKIGQFFFISSPSLTFPEICPMFFYLFLLLTFPRIGGMFFFSKCFFYHPPSLDFVFFLI